MPFRRKTMEAPPPETRLDRWNPDEVYAVLETALGEAIHQADAYRRCDQAQREQVLAALDVKLRTAQEAVNSLRRRVARKVPI